MNHGNEMHYTLHNFQCHCLTCAPSKDISNYVESLFNYTFGINILINYTFGINYNYKY